MKDQEGRITYRWLAIVVLYIAVHLVLAFLYFIGVDIELSDGYQWLRRVFYVQRDWWK